MRRSRCAVVAIVLVVCLAAGCGGTSKTGASAASSPAVVQPRTDTTPRKSSSAGASHGRARFVAAAEAICRRLSREIADPKGTVLNAKNLARLAPRHAALEKNAVRELSGLTPPTSVTADWLKILAYRRTLAADLAKLGEAGKVNDIAAINELGDRKRRLYRELSALATRDGLAACGRAGKAAALPLPPLARGAKHHA